MKRQTETDNDTDAQAIVEVRRRMADGEPLCEIEEDLDWRENYHKEPKHEAYSLH